MWHALLPSQQEMYRKLNKLNSKEEIEKENDADLARDLARIMSGNMSFSQWNKQRSARSFELNTKKQMQKKSSGKIGSL